MYIFHDLQDRQQRYGQEIEVFFDQLSIEANLVPAERSVRACLGLHIYGCIYDFLHDFWASFESEVDHTVLCR